MAAFGLNSSRDGEVTTSPSYFSPHPSPLVLADIGHTSDFLFP